MLTQSIGEFRIDRVVESEGAYAPVAFLLPDFDEQVLKRLSAEEWLRPDFLAADNTLIMSFHSFVVRTPTLNILIDTCVGNDKERPSRPDWHRRRSTEFPERLAALGLQPEDIDVVMCTHLHADHVGWNTVLRDGRWVPTFPRARYLFARREYDFWESRHRDALQRGLPALNHGSFADSVLPVVEAGQADFIGSGHDIAPGLRIDETPGHTPGTSVLIAQSGSQRALFTGDVFHTPVQIAVPAWSSRFCEDPKLSASSRSQLLESVCDTDAVIMAAHFPGPTAGRVESEPGGSMRWRCLHCAT